MLCTNQPNFTPDFGGEPAFGAHIEAPICVPALLAGMAASAETHAEAAALEALIVESERLGDIHTAHENAGDPDDITDAAELVWMSKYGDALEACGAILAKPAACSGDRLARATASLRGAAYLHITRKNWGPLSLEGALTQLTDREPNLIAQAVIYLADDPPATNPAAPIYCPVAALAPELERLLDAEDIGNTGPADERDALSLRIADLQATSAAGAIVQLLLASEQADLIRGCYGQEARERHHDSHEKLLRSAICALGVPVSPTLHVAYLGPVEAQSDQPVATPTAADLLRASDEAFSEDRDEDYSSLSTAFVAAPIKSAADALAKLRWMKRAFTAGETGQEIDVLRQLVEFMGADPDEALADPDYDPIEGEEPALLAAE